MVGLDWGRNSDHLAASKVFQILVVGDDVNQSSGTWQRRYLESLGDSQEFFVMGVRVEFRGGKGMRKWT